MPTNTTALLRNPAGIGSLFFSGSQTVIKGDAVTWILDETYAFKTTEKCKVSTNASPFVELSAGQTFLIYKRTQEDIDAKNTKGIYIFDRDTVVALAYPQEVTQDIIIENDIYNNNLNEITIEMNQTPTAKITLSTSSPVVGQSVTVSGTSSYAVDPATIASYSWKLNGVNKGSGSSFTYTPTVARVDDVLLVITDSDGRKNSSSTGIRVTLKPALSDIVMTESWKYSFGLNDPSWRQILSKPFVDNGTGTIGISVSVGFWALAPSANKNAELRVLINGVQKAYGNVIIPAGANQNFIATAISSYAGTLNTSSTIKVQIRDLGGTPSQALSGGGSSQGNNELQIKITNRTS